jgi:hypothetical protein
LALTIATMVTDASHTRWRSVPHLDAEHFQIGTKTPSNAGIRAKKKILQVFRIR